MFTGCVLQHLLKQLPATKACPSCFWNAQIPARFTLGFDSDACPVYQAWQSRGSFVDEAHAPVKDCPDSLASRNASNSTGPEAEYCQCYDSVAGSVHPNPPIPQGLGALPAFMNVW